MSSNYDVGTRAWQPDAAEGWVASEVTKKQVDGDNVILTFKLENGEVSSFQKPLGAVLQDAVVDTASTGERAQAAPRYIGEGQRRDTASADEPNCPRGQ